MLRLFILYNNIVAYEESPLQFRGLFYIVNMYAQRTTYKYYVQVEIYKFMVFRGNKNIRLYVLYSIKVVKP